MKFWTFSAFLDYADLCGFFNQYSQTYFDHHSYMDTKFLLFSETFFCQIVIVEASLLSSEMMFLFSFSALGTRLILCLFIGLNVHTVSIKFWLFCIFTLFQKPFEVIRFPFSRNEYSFSCCGLSFTRRDKLDKFIRGSEVV